MTRLVLLALLLCACIARADDSVAPASLAEQADALSQSFVGQLKPALQKAMNEGGPARAIEVCASLAPRIASALSEDSGWLVRRVSLNPRNASRAEPDEWEVAVLQDFNKRRANGAAPEALVHSATVEGHYRYMRAQVTEGLCLTCHGTALPEAALDTLAEYYPDDAATGYRLGEVRGAISLTRIGR